jgi:hypothetical protein
MQEDQLLHEIAIFFSTQKMDLATSNRVFSLEKSHLIFPHQMQAVENLRDSFYSRTIPITKYQGNKIQYIAPPEIIRVWIEACKGVGVLD